MPTKYVPNVSVNIVDEPILPRNVTNTDVIILEKNCCCWVFLTRTALQNRCRLWCYPSVYKPVLPSPSDQRNGWLVHSRSPHFLACSEVLLKTCDPVSPACCRLCHCFWQCSHLAHLGAKLPQHMPRPCGRWPSVHSSAAVWDRRTEFLAASLQAGEALAGTLSEPQKLVLKVGFVDLLVPHIYCETNVVLPLHPTSYQ